MLSLFFLSFTQLNPKVLELPNAEGLSFCQAVETCAILNAQKLDQLHSVIRRFPSISFASNSELGNAVAVTYFKGKLVQESETITDALVACNELLALSSGVQRGGAELLKKTLESGSSHFISVSNETQNFCEKAACGYPVICVDGKTAENFGINETGKYVYHGSDRELVRVSSFDRMPEQLLDDIESVDLLAKPFVAGYFIDESERTEEHQREFETMRDVASVSGVKSKFFIGAFRGGIAKELSLNASLDYIPSPLFAVIDTQNHSRRWAIVEEEQIHDTAFISQLLQGIAAGKIEPVPISQRINESDECVLSHDTFWPVLNTTNCPVAVVFLGDDSLYGVVWSMMFRELNAQLNKSIRFFIFDTSQNDIPPCVTVPSVPRAMLYNSARTQVDVFGNRPYPAALLAWIQETTNIEVPDSLADKLGSIFDGDAEADDVIVKLVSQLLGREDANSEEVDEYVKHLNDEL